MLLTGVDSAALVEAEDKSSARPKVLRAICEWTEGGYASKQDV
ncbi:MAG: hypothetical protein ACLQJR_30140 [Stellaceae bacterium]